jgi:hypothetical protein
MILAGIDAVASKAAEIEVANTGALRCRNLAGDRR